MSPVKNSNPFVINLKKTGVENMANSFSFDRKEGSFSNILKPDEAKKVSKVTNFSSTKIARDMCAGNKPNAMSLSMMNSGDFNNKNLGSCSPSKRYLKKANINSPLDM